MPVASRMVTLSLSLPRSLCDVTLSHLVCLSRSVICRGYKGRRQDSDGSGSSGLEMAARAIPLEEARWETNGTSVQRSFSIQTSLETSAPSTITSASTLNGAQVNCISRCTELCRMHFLYTAYYKTTSSYVCRWANPLRLYPFTGHRMLGKAKQSKKERNSIANAVKFV